MTVDELIAALQQQSRLGAGSHVVRIGGVDTELHDVTQVSEVFGEDVPVVALQWDLVRG